MRFAGLFVTLLAISAITAQAKSVGRTPASKRRAARPYIRSIALYATAGIFKAKPGLRSWAGHFCSLRQRNSRAAL